MKKTTSIFVCIIFICMAAFISPCAAEIVDRIVAVVNDEPITQSELDINFMPIYEQYKKTYHGEELQKKLTEARASVLTQLVDDKLIYQEAVDRGVTVSDDEVMEKINELRERFASDADFKDQLYKQGLSMKMLKKRFTEQIAAFKLHQYEVVSKVIISPYDMETYYQGHLDLYTVPERVKVRTIMVKKNPAVEAVADTRLRMEALMERQRKGESFADLAREASDESHAADGGALGFVKRGEMIPKIDQAIFQASIGTVTDIIESEIGFHVFYVEVKQEKAVRAFDEVKDMIRAEIFRQRSEIRHRAWIDELKQNAYISIK